MKALVLKEKSSNSHLEIMDVDVPKINNDEVLIEVHAVGLNPVDYKLARSGNKNWIFPHTLGLDASGIIVECGSNVHHLKNGDRVFFHSDLNKSGCFSEYAKTSALSVALMDELLTFETAAAIPCAGMTAYQALNRKLNLIKGKTILIHAGSGGVGGFAIQLAKLKGLTVITTCSSSNFDWVKRLGADFAIDYTKEDVTKRVLELTDGLGADYILNTVSGESALEDLERIAYNGHFVCIVDWPELQQVNVWKKAISIHTIALGGAHSSNNPNEIKDLSTMNEELAELIIQNKIDPLVTNIITFEEIPKYLDELSKRHVRGKIVAKLK